MSDTEIIRWHKAGEKEPNDGDNIILHLRDGYFFVTYLPPRRGDELGDWQFDDGTIHKAKPYHEYCEMKGFLDAVVLDGKFGYKRVTL